MCQCGADPFTPFCEAPGCDWPDDDDDSDIAIADFLTTARACAINGLMSFEQFLKLVAEFDPKEDEHAPD
jgi:hypothetical protein